MKEKDEQISLCSLVKAIQPGETKEYPIDKKPYILNIIYNILGYERSLGAKYTTRTDVPNGKFFVTRTA